MKIVVLVTLSLLPRLAQAEDTCPTPVESDGDVPTSPARAIYLAGERLYAAGHYDEAAVAFASALERSGHADLYFALANAYERMGERAPSVTALRRKSMKSRSRSVRRAAVVRSVAIAAV